MTVHSLQYERVLRSKRWRNVRYQALQRAHFRCEDCGVSGKLEGHHWRGRSMLGRETPDDLRMLCRLCHDVAEGRVHRPEGAAWLLWVFGFCVLAEVVWQIVRAVLHSVGIWNG